MATDPLSIPVEGMEEEESQAKTRTTAVESVNNEERSPAAIMKRSKTPKGASTLEKLLPDTARVRFEKVMSNGKLAIVGREYSTEEVILAGGIKALLEKYFVPKYGGGEYVPILIGKDGVESPRNSITFLEPEPSHNQGFDPERFASTIFDRLEAQREAEERRQREREEERRKYEEAQRKRDEEFMNMLQMIATKKDDSSSNVTTMMMLMFMKQMMDSHASMMMRMEEKHSDSSRLTKEDIAAIVREEVRKFRPVSSELPELHHSVPSLGSAMDDDRYQKLFDTIVDALKGSQAERLTVRDLIDIITRKPSDDSVDRISKIAELIRSLQPQSSSEVSELRNMVIELTKLLASGRSGESEIERIASTMEKIVSIASKFGGGNKDSSTADLIVNILSILSESEIGKAIATKIKASAARDAVLARQAAGELIQKVSPSSQRQQEPQQVNPPQSSEHPPLPKVIPSADQLNTATTDEEYLNAFVGIMKTLYSDPAWRMKILGYLTTLKSSGKEGLAVVAQDLCSALVRGGVTTQDRARKVVSLIDTYRDEVWQALGGSSPDSQESSKESENSEKDFQN